MACVQETETASSSQPMICNHFHILASLIWLDTLPILHKLPYGVGGLCGRFLHRKKHYTSLYKLADPAQLYKTRLEQFSQFGVEINGRVDLR